MPPDFSRVCFVQLSSLTASAHSQHEECTSSGAQAFTQHISSFPESIAQIIKVNCHLAVKADRQVRPGGKAGTSASFIINLRVPCLQISILLETVFFSFSSL